MSGKTIDRDRESGGNQSGLRDKNARLILSFIRRNGETPSAEIARRSGLSAQTVSNITRALEAEGLLSRGAAIKGKVGKPSVPVALNPRGVNALGLSIGRRSSELVLVDFNGTPIETLRTTYAYPSIEDVFGFLRDGTDQIFRRYPSCRARTTGIGVARPGQLWNWLEIVNAPETAMRKWQDMDLHNAVSEITGLEVFLENDATSACVAEQLLGRGRALTDFAYVFMGAFIGGGLVLNGRVISGRTLNSAALGPLPVPGPDGEVTSLLNVASLYELETAVADAGYDPDALRDESEDWITFEATVAPWIDTTAHYLAITAAAISALVEVEAILIDGAMPARVRRRLATATRREFEALDLTLLEAPRIDEAIVGKRARSLGAALLPIHARYFLS